MDACWRIFRRFWVAEEVPRWFGFSIVLIVVAGMGMVAWMGLQEGQAESARYFETHSRYATNALAAILSADEVYDPSDPKQVARLRQAMRDFGKHVSSRHVRVIDGRRRIVASLLTSDLGTIAKGEPLATQAPGSMGARTQSARSPDGEWQTLTRRLDAVLAGNSAARSSPLYLEVVLPSIERTRRWDIDSQARILVVILVVLGGLLIVYRGLRSQLSGAAMVSQRLRARGDQIAGDLAVLQVTDVRDEVTIAWNALVDEMEKLSEAAAQSDANRELSSALARTSSGALPEAFHALPDGILYITDEVRFEYVNAAGCRFFGWDSGEAQPSTLSEAKVDGVGEQVLCLVREALGPDGNYGARNEIIAGASERGTESNSFRVSVLPISRGHQVGECLVTIRDVSQQIRAEKAREDFVTQVTHELRTPLTSIRAYAETLSSGMFDDPKVITDCYNVITKETRRLSRLIEDILSVSQLDVGTIQLVRDAVDLNALLGDSIRDVRSLADEKNIDIQLVLPAKMDTVDADRDKLSVVINNLLGNAIKYTPAGGNVVVACQFRTDELVISFKDNGIGIGPDDQARVFEKFQRGKDAEVQNEAGTGIGLYTAREIVRRHGGEIELISTLGQGSTFMVRLPHQPSRAAVMSSQAKGIA